MTYHHPILLLLLLLYLTSSQINRLPIGSIFDETTEGYSREGFRFEIARYNNLSDSFFKVDSLEKMTLSSNQFNFTRTECDILENGVFVVVASTSPTTQSMVESVSRTFHVPHIITSEPTSFVAKFAPPSHNNPFLTPEYSELLGKDAKEAGVDGTEAGIEGTETGKDAEEESLKQPLFELPTSFTPPQLISSSSSSSSLPFSTSSFSLYIRPRFEAAYVDLFQYLKWNKFFYLYDSQQGLSHLEHLYSIINQRSRSFRLEMVFIENVTSAYEPLRAIDQSEPSIPKYIFLDLSSEAAFYTLWAQILNLGMHRLGYHYIMAGSFIDLVDLTTFKYGGVNITGFRLVDKESSIYTQALGAWKNHLSKNRHNHLFNDKHIPLEAAINMDAVTLLERGLRELFQREERLLSVLFKKGVIHNDGVRGVKCLEPFKAWKNGSTVVEYLKKVTFKGLTGQVTFNEDGFRRSFSLDLLDMGLNRPLTKIGTWNEETGVHIETTDHHNGSRSRPNATIVVTTVMESPYVMLRKRQETDDGIPLTGNDIFEGYCADLASQVAALVHYKYILKEVGDKKYGAELPDRSWNGMIGELTRREADMAIAPLTITSIRERVLDFSKPFMNLGISIMIKKPEKQKPGVFSFMDPIDNYIWTLICISYLGVSFTLFLVCKFSPYEWNEDAVDSNNNEKANSPFKNNKPYQGDGLENSEISCYEKCDRPRRHFDFAAANNDGNDNNYNTNNNYYNNNNPRSSHNSDGESSGSGEEKAKTDFTLKNSFWFVLGAFMQQGVGLSPKSISGRLVGSSWWFFTLIIVSSYTANLAAFLTVERMLTPINSADDLVKQTEIQYGTLDSGSSKAFFMNSNISVYKEMWSFMRSSDPGNFVKKTEFGVEKVRISKGKYAFLLESTMNEYHNQRKPCNTMRVGENLDSKGYGIATPIGHPLKVPVGLAILKLKEVGKLAKLQKKWWYDKGECPADGEGKGGGSFQSAMTLSNVAGIFYILISGLGVSMVVSLLEFLSKTCHDARKNKVKFSKMIQEKLKLPSSSETDACEDQPSSSHQLISQANHHFSKSSPLTASSSLRGKPATLPKRFNPHLLSSPSVESSFRQAALQQQPQFLQQQQQNFYLQQLHHPPYNHQLILPQQSSSAASPLQINDFKNEGDFLNRQYNFHSDLDPPSITSDNFSSKCLVPAVRSSSVSLV